MMGKSPYFYTDSEETEDTSSSIENVKKRKKLSILKFTTGNNKKKKCQVHSKTEQDLDFRSRSRSSQRIATEPAKHKLRGILKHTEREFSASEEDEDSEPSRQFRSQDRCLVGQVPRRAGSKLGRGGGLAIVVRKNISAVPCSQQSSTSSTKRGRSSKRMDRKRSY